MKPWYRSKTVWLNVVTLIIGVAALLADGDYGADVAKAATLVAALATSCCASCSPIAR